ncbi:hypothetical protein VTN96DRAFT_398 [Rasamsonia emersonii]
MDELTEKRLQDIQMADLGTARREYISSVDKPNKFTRIRKEQLEASRLSNVDEAVRRIAEQNKEQLSAWSSLYKQVDDTGGLEDLDTMMDGQSHRAQLSATIQESGGQTYVETPSSGNSPQPRAHARDARDPGRGGGNVGRRGRGSSVSNTQSSPRKRSRGRPVMMHGHQLAEMQRHLDPALDTNTRSPSRGRGRRDPKDRRTPTKPSKPPGIKVRRPVHPQIPGAPQQNYETFLAEPEGFLAAIRKNRSASVENPGEDVVHAAATTSDDTSEAARPELPEGASNPDTELLDLHSHSGVTTPVAAENQQSLSTTKDDAQSLATAEDEATTNSLTKVQQSHPPESVNMTQKAPFSEPSKASVSTESVEEDDEKDNTQDKPRPTKVFSSNLPQPQIFTQKYSRAQEAETPKTKLDENNDLLLDFSTSTVTTTRNPEKESVPPSAAVQDLMDIDFSRRSRSSSRSVASVQHGPSPSETASPGPAIRAEKAVTPQAPRSISSISSKPSPAKIPVVSYLQELAFINDTLPSLTGEDAENLNERRNKLIRLISGVTEGKAAENLTSLNTRKASEVVSAAMESLSIRSPEDNPPVQEREQAEPAQKKSADVEKTKVASSSQGSSPSELRLRQAVLAAPFVPRSSSSSESPVPSRRRMHVPEDDDDHIFGEHTLPGRSRPSSISTSNSVLRAPSTDRPPNTSGQAFPAVQDTARHGIPDNSTAVDRPVASTTGGPISSSFSYPVESAVPAQGVIVNQPTWPAGPLSETTSQYGTNLPLPSIPQNDLTKSTHPNPTATPFKPKGENQSPAHHASHSLCASRHAPTASASLPGGFGQPSQPAQYQAPVQTEQQPSPAPPTRSLYASRHAPTASSSPAASPSPRFSHQQAEQHTNQPFARQNQAAPSFQQRGFPHPWSAASAAGVSSSSSNQPMQPSQYQQQPPVAAAAQSPQSPPLPQTRSLYASRYAILPDDDKKKPLR